MPDNIEEEKPSEETKPEEVKEKEETSEDEVKKEDVKEEPVEDEEPKKRFPQQKAEDNKLGYKLRKLEEENKRLRDMKEVDDEFDTEEKPVTRRELNELLEKIDKKSASETMLQQFLSENNEFRKHEKLIRKYVNDPDYSNVPIGFIASGVIGGNIDDEANQRAELKIKADEEAGKTKTGGSSKRSVPGKKKSIWDMSKEEFEEHQTDVLQRGRR